MRHSQLMWITIALILALTAPALASVEPENIATFSVVAYNPATGEVGVAVQSKFFAVGSVVPYAKAGVGAIASQAYGNTTFGPRGLNLLSEGATPEETLAALIRFDEDSARRQVGLVSVLTGTSFSYTGAECMDWAGGKTGVTDDGIVYAVQGNILTGENVVELMAMGIETGGVVPDAEITPEVARALWVDDFAGRLLAALVNGQIAGGDSRGMQSAALIVEQAGTGYGGYNDRKYDLRVDDAADPFNELARLLNMARPFALITDGYAAAYAGDFERAFEVFDGLLILDPEDLSHHYHYACALALSGDPDGALEHLRIALEFEPLLKVSAPEDPDLVSLYDLPEFKELTKAEE